MRLDFQIILKSSPLTLLAASTLGAVDCYCSLALLMLLLLFGVLHEVILFMECKQFRKPNRKLFFNSIYCFNH